MGGQQFQVTAMQEHNLTAQAEADASTLFFGCIKRQEHFITNLLGDTGAIVVHLDIG